MNIRKVAVIFDDEARPDTTGVYCRKTLSDLVEVSHFRPKDLSTIPRGVFDLYLNIDDGLEYAIPPELRPCAWWAIDTHLNYDWCLNRARGFDWVFTAQLDGAEQMRRDGISSATWLPLACDPGTHCKHNVVKEHDVCFVGNLFPGPRTELVELLLQRYPRMFAGRRFFAEMARTYSASRIVLNRSIRNDVNMRVFEAVSCGSLLMTNDLSDNGQDELFQDGRHLATYRSSEELLDKIDFYLKRIDVRERVAAEGMREAHAKHTYCHRMKRLLNECERSLASSRIGRTTESPAHRSNPKRRSVVDFGLTSIIIVTHNQLDFTRGCIESIQRSTPEPHELILVDNGSIDATLNYFHSIPGATVIANPDNRGFPAAVNQGIREASGQQVILLNNDTTVPNGWLERLLRPLVEDDRIGLVGPCSNQVSGEQRIAAQYGDIEGLEEFAAKHAMSHAGVRELTDRLVGFCLLIRRDVIDEVGLLDEQFGIGCFEDDDYCRRSLAAGWKAVIARDAFVHHAGGRTFVGVGVDFATVMRENKAKYDAKWAGGPDTTRLDASGPRIGYTIRRAAVRGLLLERKEKVLSVTMIVRDNAPTIAAALESIRPWVDEMVVVDTGSTDDTALICRRLGAIVSEFAWVDDFSAARNESFRLASGKWLFWMDSDDVINAACGRKLRELAYGSIDPSVMGYIVQVRCTGPTAQDDVTVVDHVKLVRSHPDIRFEGRIHEQILPAIRRLGGDVAWTDLFVTHAGYDHSPEGQARKLERDLRLLHLEVAKQPEHPFVHFNLGMTYADAGRYGEAAAYLRKSIAVAGPTESHLRKAYALLVSSLDRKGEPDEAMAACEQGMARFPLDTELRFRRAMLLHESGRLHEAAEAYENLLAQPDERHFSSAVDGLSGTKARNNLAIVYSDLGAWEGAEEQWRKILNERPNDRAAQLGLAEAVQNQRRNRESAVGRR